MLVTEDNKIAIEKRTEKGLLSGMYQFPNWDGFYSDESIKSIINEYSLAPVEVSFLKETKHVFTHIDWYMKGYLVTVKQKSDRFLWVSHKELLEKYALPTAFQIFAKMIL